MNVGKLFPANCRRGSTGLRRLLAGLFPYKLALQFLRSGDAEKLFWVNPNKVNYALEGKGLSRFRRKNKGRFVIAPWMYEEHITKIEREVPHPTVHSVWVEGLDFQETDQYRAMMRAVETYKNGECEYPSLRGAYWCRSYEDVSQYFQELSNTYEDIRDNGYRSQEELTLGRSGRRPGDEIKILIDRLGNPIFHASGANHRFSICRLLKLRSIPAKVIAIDEDWLLENCKSPGMGFRRRFDAIQNAVEARLSFISQNHA